MKNPHDRIFKETLTRRENAVSFFREYLPGEIVSKLDWRTLKISKETFVEPELRERFSDIVYEIRAKGRRVFVYLLMEHQSTVDPWMPLRLLGYMLRLWELWRKQNPDEKKLPGIIPVLFYHGKDEWDVSVDFRDLIKSPELTEEFVPGFKYLLRDFSQSGNEDIRGTVLIRLFLSMMNGIFSPRFGGIFDRMIPLLAELSRKETGMEYIETVLRYICHTSDALSWKDMETKLIQAFDEDRKGDIMTIADELRMEGEIRGEIRGEIKMCRELMEKGFIHREVAEQKIAELSKKLEEITGVQIMSAGGFDAPDRASA
ncbi:Rpn family recombination-promoting nuclease/putative transposase [Desulfococcaceae bacterium HSG8]|nr:Rpn family recombination-promoting nuclease/putative transposase [Desulfococcaceae bacterium HSG8]